MTSGPRALILRVDGGDAPAEPARARARALADRFHGAEQVLVLDPLASGARLAGPEAAHASRSAPRRWLTRAALLARRDWLRRTVVDVARRVHARLLVLPATGWVTPALALDLAAGSGVPTLVVRASTTANRIVAATDLRDPGLPVVAGAAAWAHDVDASLLLVHDGDSPGARARLVRAARAVGGEAQVTLTAHDDPARALLALSHQAGADLVMVGARRRPWWDLRPRPRVAELVVAGARSSVLLVPLAANDPLAELVP